jgi:hypothetical protein
MKRFRPVFSLLTVLAFVGGCQHPRTARIQEHAALFASLDPGAQRLIRDGLFDYGFSRELVYIALGKPNRTSTRETETGTVETWVYRNFVYANIGAVRLSTNTPGSKPYGPIVASNAPGGPSIASTKAGPTQPTIGDGTDAPVGTLSLEFVNGRVANIRIDP